MSQENTFVASSNPQVTRAIGAIESNALLFTAFLDKVKKQQEITVEEFKYINALRDIYVISIRALKRQNPDAKHLNASLAIKETIQKNAPPFLAQDSTRPEKINDAVGHIIGHLIKTPAGDLTIYDERRYNVSFKSALTYTLDSDAKGQLVCAPTDPAQHPFRKPGLSEAASKGGKPVQETYHGLAVIRHQSEISRQRGERSKNNGLTGNFFTNSGHTRKNTFEDRISWICAIAKSIDPQAELHAPEHWNPDDPKDPRIVIIDFPSINKKVFVSRKLGLSTLILNDNEQDPEELLSSSYGAIWQRDETRIVELRKKTKDLFITAITDELKTPFSKLGKQKKGNAQWRKNPNAAREILMEFAKIDGIKMTKPLLEKQIFSILKDNVPDVALDFKNSTLAALDTYLYRSRKKITNDPSLTPEESAKAFEDRKLPESVRNITTGIRWVRDTMHGGPD